MIMAAAALSASSFAASDPLDRWSNYIAEASARFGIPAAWIADVIRVESHGRTMIGGRPIVSSAGAIGLMQLMPGTWREMRATLGLGPDPQQPRDNILAGTAYLRLMYDRFGYPGAFAAYNAGPARYAAFLSGHRGLSGETRAYAAKIGLAGAKVGGASEAALFTTRAAATSAAAGSTLVPRSSSTLFVPLRSAAGP